MTLRPALALLFLAACTHPPPAVADPVDGVDAGDGGGDPVADSGRSLLESAPAAPDASAIALAADGGLAALLSGAVPAASLAEVATDPGSPLDRGLRERLTTREAPDPSSLAGIGGATPEAIVTVKSVMPTSPMADADRVVAGFRPRARACYRLGLERDPTMEGKLVIEVKVGASGEVGDAKVAQNLGLSSRVAGCVAHAYKNATFDPPAGGAGATLTVTLTFASGGI